MREVTAIRPRHRLSVLRRTWVLLKDTTHVLPEGVSIARVRAAIAAVPGVVSLHDLHLWGMPSEDTNASVHVGLIADADGDAVLQAIATLLKNDFDIHHATIQTRRDPGVDVSELHT